MKMGTTVVRKAREPQPGDVVIVLLKMEQRVLELSGYVESVSDTHVHFDLNEVGVARSLKDDDYPLESARQKAMEENRDATRGKCAA
jgi:hypothetical protein